MRKLKGVGRKLIPILFCVILVAGCATHQQVAEKQDFVTITYKSIKTISEIYNMSMGALGTLYKQRKISEDEKDKAIKYGEEFRHAKDMAVETLISYMKTKDQSGLVLVQTAVGEALRLYGVFAELIQPMLMKGK